MSASKPVFVVVPGNAYTPAHYGYLLHLFLKAGYGALSGMLPSTGTLNSGTVTVVEDAEYIRNRLVLPVLDNEQRDVIIVGHSYSAMPASAAVAGLHRAARAATGKKTAVIGQIYIAGVIPKGGDGNSLVTAFGGSLPPHIRADEDANLIRCDDIKPPLMHDVDATLAMAAGMSTVCPCLTSFQSEVPRASWDDDGYKDRIAYIKTTQDRAVPLQVQEMLIQASGVAWITREIDSSHSPSLSKPEELASMVVEIANQFEMASKE